MKSLADLPESLSEPEQSSMRAEEGLSGGLPSPTAGECLPAAALVRAGLVSNAEGGRETTLLSKGVFTSGKLRPPPLLFVGVVRGQARFLNRG
jgi:hypothetical protein